jgi:putative ABC transport system permease protein
MLCRNRKEREMDEEMRFHIDAHAADLVGGGVAQQEALRRARVEFGGIERVKEECRDAVGVSFLEMLFQDVRQGTRSMLRTPVFTAIALIVLALGIGANTAIFSVVDAVLLRPLAYRDSNRLVTILMNGEGPVSAGNYIDWRDQSRSFTAMSAAEAWSPNLTGFDSPEHLPGLKVTQDLFPMLGIDPMLGRLFVPEEDKEGANREVIISYRLWQRRFSSDPSVLGKAIVLDGNGYVIVGVMPQEFQFAPFWATKAELWAPGAFGPGVHAGGGSLRIFARLKDGVSLTQARAEIASITARLEQQFPGTNRNVVMTPLKEKVVGPIETPLLVLLAAVAFVLLITCANVAHMLLARAATRQKEIAVRAALGARRGRLVRQFLTESLLLGGIGGVLGLLIAVLGTRALIAMSPTNIPRVQTVSIDLHAALFLFAATVLTTIGFGLVPALQASSVNVNDTLKEGGRGNSEGLDRNRLRSLLVVSEFALALMLLIGAGLMIRTFAALEAVDPGFNPHNVISMIVSVSGSKEEDPGRRELFYRQLIERVRSLPGVQAAGAINHLPLAGDLWGWHFAIEGRPKPRPGEKPGAVYRMVTPGYFAAMQLPIVRGRDITDSDNATAPGVIIINEQAARQYWPGEDPLGKRVSFADDTTDPKTTWLTIIGIAKDAKQDSWTDKATPEAYLAAFQNHDYLGDSGTEASKHMDYITLVARAAGNPALTASAMKEVSRAFDRNLAITQVVTMDGVVAEANAQPRFEMLLLTIFAAVALALAAVGIYGVISYSASRRTHEIGVRMSLGATRCDVLLLVVRQGLWLAVAGSVAGIAGALLLSRLMAKLLYGVQPTDPATFGAVAVGLGVVAMLACYLPARRAMHIDPMAALRYE